MRTTYYIFLLLIALIIISCEDKNSYVLNGNIKGLKNPELYIVSNADMHVVDTVRTQSGKFTYRGVSPNLESLVIYMENGNSWITLWVQNGEKYSVTGDSNYPELMMIKGGEVNKLLTEFKVDNSALIKEQCDLRDKLKARSENHAESSVSGEAQLTSQLKNVEQILKTHAQDFIEANPSTISALIMIQDYILDVENAGEIFPLLNLVTDKVKENTLYEHLNTRCLRDMKTKVGQPALDFKLKNTQNDTIKLESFKGKYLILTFAASQCEFCKPEYDELHAIQKAFSAKELAILTISLDENKENWKKVAQENGINWNQVIDSTGWASEMVTLYNVFELPCNYLIDKNGIIIGSKLHVDNIQTILNEKLKRKN